MDAIERVIEVLNGLRPPWLLGGSINLKLVDDAAMRVLNNQYAGNDYSTDVLSFSYINPDVPIAPSALVTESELGDMVISVETAQRQADEAGTNLGTELATLALHGTMHIFGFDHAKLEGRQTMDKWQADILGQAGVKYRDFKWV